MNSGDFQRLCSVSQLLMNFVNAAMSCVTPKYFRPSSGFITRLKPAAGASIITKSVKSSQVSGLSIAV